MKNKPESLLSSLEKQAGKISNALKILLTTDGSITSALEVLYGKISVDLSQKIFLNGKVKRKIKMSFNKCVLVCAASFIDMKLLPQKAAKDLLDCKLPIGKILKKHKLETRREITSIEYDKLQKRFKRKYKIISGGKPAMLITESFSDKIK